MKQLRTTDQAKQLDPRFATAADLLRSAIGNPQVDEASQPPRG